MDAGVPSPEQAARMFKSLLSERGLALCFKGRARLELECRRGVRSGYFCTLTVPEAGVRLNIVDGKPTIVRGVDRGECRRAGGVLDLELVVKAAAVAYRALSALRSYATQYSSVAFTCGGLSMDAFILRYFGVEEGVRVEKGSGLELEFTTDGSGWRVQLEADSTSDAIRLAASILGFLATTGLGRMYATGAARLWRAVVEWYVERGELRRLIDISAMLPGAKRMRDTVEIRGRHIITGIILDREPLGEILVISGFALPGSDCRLAYRELLDTLSTIASYAVATSMGDYASLVLA